MYINEAYYPLTNSQMLIWMAENLYPNTNQAILGALLIIDGGKEDYLMLNESINLVIKSNNSLRIQIANLNGEPVQYIANYNEQDFEYYDFSFMNMEVIHKWSKKRVLTPFKNLISKLYDFVLLSLPNNKIGILIKIHHIINDGWGMCLFISIFLKCFKQLKNQETLDIQEYSYIPHIESELKNVSKYSKLKEFWDNLFDSIPEFTSFSNKPVTSIASKRKTYQLTQDLTKASATFCEEHKISQFSLFYSIVSIILWKITGKIDMVIGTPILNRSNYKEKNTIGMFVNIIPTRAIIEPQLPFIDYVNKTFLSLKKCLRKQHYPLNEILKDFRAKYPQSGKLIDIMFNFQNHKIESKMDYNTIQYNPEASVDSLSIRVNDREGDGKLNFEYDYIIGILSEEEIEFIHQSFCNLLNGILHNPQKLVFDSFSEI